MTSQEMAELQKYYRSLKFKRKYTYEGNDLGVYCRGRQSDFALWAPIARKVTLILYADGDTGPELRRIPMKKTEHGVWRYREHQNLHGTYYLYEIDQGWDTFLSGDPYAAACGADSRRCMAVDLRQTNPLGWTQDRGPEPENESIIWETHVKEFSQDPSGGFPEAMRGKYLAFTCPDTSLYGEGLYPTGLAHLKQLGVNTLQIMPFFDYGSVREDDPSQFNWGYDPMYYNIPEGSYSSDAHHGEVRIRQCKQMIQSLHRNGFRVVMDVVYNHSYAIDSPMNRTVPGYYYRHDPEGHACNGSYCGNDIASERPMVSHFILNSVLYWAEEYHIDGFRFDLMGLLDVKLMNRIQLELDRKFGRGEKFIYGEPWAATNTCLEKKAVQALKQNAPLFNPRIAMFCDNTRDAIKGNVFFSAQPGFVGGAPNMEHSILNAARAWVDSIPGICSPGQMITYVSCHDNLTLYDKLKQSSPEGRDLLALNRLAAAIYLSCQGHILMLSGEEFARTKNGNDNSYNAPVEVNALHWERILQYQTLTEYYKGLIAIRKRSPGLWDKSPQASDRFYFAWESPGAVGYYLDNRGPGGDGTLCVIYNASEQPLTHELLPGTWELWADGESSFRWKEHRFLSGNITVAPCSAMILSQDGMLDKGE